MCIQKRRARNGSMPEHTNLAGAQEQSAMHTIIGIWISLFIIQALCLELQEQLACDEDELHLECDAGSFLAIHEARYTTNASEGMDECILVYDTYEGTLMQPPSATSNISCTEDIRMPLNYRCSGNRSCKFSLARHYPTRLCEDPGTLIVLYDCVPEVNVHTKCNRIIEETEGYVKSPGYSFYYPGPLNCEWTLRAQDGQRMLVSVLDLSLVDSLSDDDHCPDRFRLVDGQSRLLDTCGEKRNTLRQFESEGNQVKAQFTTHAIGAKRGVLFWFKTFGCPTLPAPEHGYLVYRNASYAQYMCCTNHYFEDTLERTRSLYCLEGRTWNTQLVSCLDKKTLKEIKNVSNFFSEEEDNFQSIQKVPLSDANVLLDILIPSVIMGILVLGNAVIVAVLLKLRKSVKDDTDLESTCPNPQTPPPPPPPQTRPEAQDSKPPVVGRLPNVASDPGTHPVHNNSHSTPATTQIKPSTSTQEIKKPVRQKLVTEV